MVLPKYSIGMGDRFAYQAKAQLQACVQASQHGVDVTPVWNKSNREHVMIGSKPEQSRAAANAAVIALNWTGPYFLDADHITLSTYERFVTPCDFFTLDVADWIGKASEEDQVEAFIARHPELTGSLRVPQIAEPFVIDRSFLRSTATQFLAAIKQAGVIYRAVAASKGLEEFVAEISMDETDLPQTPPELLVILAAIADEGLPIQTIAPKFTGRFNKGVDYTGDIAQFAREFRNDLAIIQYAVERYSLPTNLKLSVHSGSDKFSIYPAIRKGLAEFDAGVHVKTAGTTWLEELIGLAESGNQALALAKEIYAEAYEGAAELCAPYSAVIDINREHLPQPVVVAGWTSEQYVRALRHNDADPEYNADLRQLLHVAFKMAAKMGSRYTDALSANATVVARNVTQNLFERHIRPIFLT